MEDHAILLLSLRDLALALAIGFLIGFEREWTNAASAREHTFAGARTFGLVGFTGGLAGLLNLGWGLIAVIFAAIAALTVTAYWAVARSRPGYGGTTEIALMATFLLGLSATQGLTLIAAIGGVTVAIVLSVKKSVEHLASALSDREIRAALRFLAISVIILPILPNQDFGPYNAFNLREIWLMVVFVSGLSFLGYWLIKSVGADRGVAATGLAGGLASSTATTLSLSRFAQTGKVSADAVATGIIASNVMMLARTALLLAAIARSVLMQVGPAFALAGVIGAGAAIYFWRRAEKDAAGGHDTRPQLTNPMEVAPALIFAGLLAILSLAARGGADLFGDQALYVIGFISGLADVDALTLTVGRQATTGAVAIAVASGAVLSAVAANIVVKASMARVVGGAALGLKVGAVFALMLLGGAMAFVLTPSV